MMMYLSHRVLLLIFMSVTILYGLVRLPASMVSFAAMGDLTYARAEGTLWRGRLYGVDTAYGMMKQVDFSLQPLSLILFNPQIHVKLRNRAMSVDAMVRRGAGEQYHVSQLTGDMSVTISFERDNYHSTVRMASASRSARARDTRRATGLTPASHSASSA